MRNPEQWSSLLLLEAHADLSEAIGVSSCERPFAGRTRLSDSQLARSCFASETDIRLGCLPHLRECLPEISQEIDLLLRHETAATRPRDVFFALLPAACVGLESDANNYNPAASNERTRPGCSAYARHPQYALNTCSYCRVVLGK